MKLDELAMVSITVPFTHNVWPTSASVIVNASRQSDTDVGVIAVVAGIWVGDATISLTTVFVGRTVEIIVGVLLGFMGVLVTGIGVNVFC
jgi:hypothetical protein